MPDHISEQEPLWLEPVTYWRDTRSSSTEPHAPVEHITIGPEEIGLVDDINLREQLEISSRQKIKDGWMRIVVANPDNTFRHVVRIPVGRAHHVEI